MARVQQPALDPFQAIAALEARVRTLETAGRLGNTSLQDGELIVYDATGTIRFEAGHLPASGVSAQQYGSRAWDATGGLLFDGTGLAAVMSSLGSATGWSQVGATGNGSWQTVSGSAVTFSLVRPTNVLALCGLTYLDPTVGDTGFLLKASLLVDSAQSAANGPTFINGSGGYSSVTPFAVINGMAAGSHTIAAGINMTNAKTWDVSAGSGYLYVFRLGG